MYKDKMAIIQVLGSIVHNPFIIIDENYPLQQEDFPERFHKIIFGAMENLVKSGATALTEVTIDDFLSKYPKQYKVFTENNGMEYISKIKRVADTANFDYYYNALRKNSLLNALEGQGFDPKLIYDTSVVSTSESAKIQERFNNYSIEDIFNEYELNLNKLKATYSLSKDASGCQAAKGMSQLVESYEQTPEMGMPMNSKKLTTICRGRRLKKLYLKTSPSGFGKTRISVGDACCVSINKIWDIEKKDWIITNCNQPTLFITTELEIDEIQTLVLAYVSAVPEDHILDGKYVGNEKERVKEAIHIIENSNLYVEYIPNFNIDDIETLIKKYKAEHQIGYVFFDYIFTSIKILTEVSSKARGIKMREDNVLLMFADRMKSLANVLNIHMDTSSQANGDWKNVKNGDQNLISGAKSMANKVDLGFVVLPVSEADKEHISTILAKGFHKQPNLVYHIYKVRRGKINHVKLWLYFDYATCRTEDLFVTDNNYEIKDVASTNVEILLDETIEQDDEEFIY